MVAEARPVVAQDGALLQGGGAGAEAEAVAQAPEIIARDIDETHGAKLRSGRCVETGLAAADAPELGAHADGHRIACRFFHIEQDVFAIGLAIGVLNRRVDAGEDAQVVQAALRIGDRRRRERIARIELQVARNQRRMRDLQARDQHFAHELLLAFVHCEEKVDAIGGRRGLGTPFEGGAGKAALEVLRENGIAIHRDVEFAERLTFGRN